MSLKKLFLTLAMLLVLAASVATGLLFQRIGENIVDDWGRRIVEIQVKLAIAVECHQRIDRPLPTLARTPKCLPSSRVPGPGHDS